MNMLSAMLWAWVGVCAVSVVAAAVIVLAQVRLEARELVQSQPEVAGGVVAQAPVLQAGCARDPPGEPAPK